MTVRRPARPAPRGLYRVAPWALASMLVGGVAGADATGPAVGADRDVSAPREQSPPEEPTLAEERAFRDAAERVAGAVVRIEPVGGAAATVPPGEPAPGAAASTGLVVDAGGAVVTTSFAVPDVADAAVVVTPAGTRLAARVVGRDRGRGLVLLRCPPIAGAPALEAVPRADLRPGQWTIAVGRGWTHARPSLAVGILSAVDRAWGRGVQTDAAVSPVNYGGPLIDIRGRVIGLVAPLPADTAGLPRGTELYDSGIGFAVPLEDVRRSVARLERGESPAPGILGVHWRGDDPINGAPVVESCRRGSPAKRGGLRVGDTIVAIDGRSVTRIADVRHALGPRDAGTEVDLVLERGEERLTVRVALAESLPPWRRAFVGLRAADAADDAGARADWVLPGSPAAAAGITAGDVITALSADADPARPVADAAGLAAALAEVEPGDRVTLKRRRGADVADVAIVTDVAPGNLPGAAPPAEQAGAGVEVVPLAAAEVATPPLAVLPTGAAPWRGALVWCGPPGRAVAAADADVWREAAARHRVAVILPGSTDPRRWGPGDVAGIVRALAMLQARRPIPPDRLAIAGAGAGAGCAWLVAEQLDGAVGGVALVNTPLPRQAVVPEAAPGRSPWMLFSAGGQADVAQRVDADRRRLEAAGLAVGLLPESPPDALPVEPLCRWVTLLALL